MIYKPFKDISLSCLGMGAMRLPMADEEHIDYEKAHAIFDMARAGGINYFDTAYVYQAGDSERCLGQWLTKQPRDELYIASKYHILASEDYEGVFEEQLRRLQTDRIDFYLIHSLQDNTVDKYLTSGCIEYFRKQKQLGRIRYLGFSSHANPENLARFADVGDWDFAQIQMNYYDWNFSTSAQEYQILTERNIPVMVMEPVRGGRLAALTQETEQQLRRAHNDWSIASWALRFVASHAGVQVILSGMSNLEQMQDNLSTFSAPCGLNEADMELLHKVCREFRSQIVVPCTECRYCTPECPMEIDIPAYLKIYNGWKVHGPWFLHQLKNVQSSGKPSDCVACGSCTGHCPQSIDIPAILAQLAEQMH